MESSCELEFDAISFLSQKSYGPDEFVCLFQESDRRELPETEEESVTIGYTAPLSEPLVPTLSWTASVDPCSGFGVQHRSRKPDASRLTFLQRFRPITPGPWSATRTSTGCRPFVWRLLRFFLFSIGSTATRDTSRARWKSIFVFPIVKRSVFLHSTQVS
jgi:hypothetical protein